MADRCQYCGIQLGKSGGCKCYACWDTHSKFFWINSYTRDTECIEYNPAWTTKLIDSGCISTPADLHTLTVNRIKKIGPVSTAAGIRLAVDKLAIIARSPSLVFYGLVSTILSKDGADRFQAFSSIWDVAAASAEVIASTAHVGIEEAKDVQAFFTLPNVMEALIEMDAAGVCLSWEKANDDIIDLSGKNVVFTGTLKSMARLQAQLLVIAHGGINQTTLTRDTNLLVCGNRVGRVKMDNAARHGTTIMSEDEFLRAVQT